jgi:non-canonical (house-cleaning) NTP pyrophosphatase
MPDVATDTLGGATERAKSVKNVDIDLARVGLRSADLGLVEAGLLGDELVELLDESVVTLEDGEERALRASRALDTTELVEEVVTSALKVAEIVEEVSDPEGSTLANSHELGRLAVGVAKAGQ